MNLFPVTPAPQQDNNRQQAHRLAVTIATPRGMVPYKGQKTPFPVGRFKHDSNGIFNAIGQGLHWAFPHNPAQHFGTQMKQTGRELGQMFDPRHPSGLVNIASLFAGGPKGDASPMMGKLGMPDQFAPYDSVVYKTGTPLDRGVVREGPTRATGGTEGAGIRGLIRRAQGVGGYKQANPLDVIEAQRAELAKRIATQEKIKAYSNRRGFEMKQLRNNARMEAQAEKSLGAQLVPFSGRLNPDFPTGSPEGVPRAFSNGLRAYNDGNNPLLSMLREMLFGGYPYGPPR